MFSVQAITINLVINSDKFNKSHRQLSMCSIEMHVLVCLLTYLLGGFSRGTPVSSTNKIDRHDITEILLNVALNTIT